MRQPRVPRHPNSSPAKIAPPTLSAVYQRRRLFRVLDRMRTRPVVWIAGPPGAGKTTLVASYLAARRIPCVWDQLDVRDGDLATFFFYLREAIRKHAPRKRDPLPLLTPEYSLGLPTFTRNFFEALFARMRAPAAVVFDNVQDVPEGAGLHQLWPEALSTVPDGIVVFMLSRTLPPTSFSRLQAQRAMHMLDAKDLQLTMEEARGVARLYKIGTCTDRAVRTLHERIGGWTTGWILLLKRFRKHGFPTNDFQHEALEATFNYFASEVFDRAAPDLQTLLLRTASMPQVAVSSAEALTGQTGAGDLLAELDRRNWFTTRLAAKEPVYRFHPLFREFLLTRAKHQLPEKAWRTLQRKAAQILCARGEYEDAATLLVQSRDWIGLSRVMLAQAPILAQQGRLAVLDGWLRALPAKWVEQRPWLLYWQGMARLAALDPAQGRSILERAYAGFKQTDDLAGQLLACAGVLDSYFLELNEFTPTDRWMGELEMLVERCPAMVSPEIEAQVISSIGAVLYRQPHHPLFPAWGPRALELLRSGVLPHQQIALSNFLFQLSLWEGDFRGCAALLREIEERPGRRRDTPFMLILLNLWRSLLYFLISEHDAAFRCGDDALRIAEETGVHVLDAMALGYMIFTALSAGDLDRAEDLITRMEAIAMSSRSHDVAFVYHLKSGLALRRRELLQARRWAMETLARVEEAGSSFNVMMCQIPLAQVLIELGEHARARSLLAAARSFAEDMRSPNFAFAAWIAEAHSFLQGGEQATGLAALGRAFALGREHDYVNFASFWLPHVMSQLCATALAQGIEPEYAKRLIKKRNLRAPTPATLHWPWRLKIRTLGRFCIEKDGVPMRFSGKVQRRPLDLLKITIALGGREVDTQLIIDELWPDTEGDAAADAFATALRRLRLLLGDPAALVLQDNKLSIDSDRVWIDVWALEHLFDQDATQDFAKILALYQGAFLANEANASWASPLRERLRSRFLRELARYGQRLMQDRQFDEAISLFEKGIEADDLAEELYAHLMRCYQALGRRGQALGVCERCRIVLTCKLGVGLSPEIETLRQALLRA